MQQLSLIELLCVISHLSVFIVSVYNGRKNNEQNKQFEKVQRGNRDKHEEQSGQNGHCVMCWCLFELLFFTCFCHSQFVTK